MTMDTGIGIFFAPVEFHPVNATDSGDLRNELKDDLLV